MQFERPRKHQARITRALGTDARIDAGDALEQLLDTVRPRSARLRTRGGRLRMPGLFLERPDEPAALVEQLAVDAGADVVARLAERLDQLPRAGALATNFSM